MGHWGSEHREQDDVEVHMRRPCKHLDRDYRAYARTSLESLCRIVVSLGCTLRLPPHVITVTNSYCTSSELAPKSGLMA